MSLVDIQVNVQTLASLNGSIESRMRKIGKNGDSRALRTTLHSDLEKATEISQRLGTHLNARIVRGDPRLEKLAKSYIKELSKTQDLASDLARAQRVTRDAAEELRRSQNATAGDVHIQMEETNGITLQTLDDKVATSQEREEQLKKVEHDVILLNDIMKDMSFMVNEQQESIDQIESNVSNTRQYVSTGERDIFKASMYQHSSRKCIGLSLLAVAVVIAIVVAVTLS